jgi:hypothetical protein
MPPRYKIGEVVGPPSPLVAACKFEQDQFISLLNPCTQIWLSCAPLGWETHRNFGLQTTEISCRSIDLVMMNTCNEFL